jgi:hypothetical protein
MIFSRTPKTPPRRFALCEHVTASHISPHHIRELTDAGMKPGGGADTLALCGQNVAWDTSEVTLAEIPDRVAHQHANYHYCVLCTAAAAGLTP